MLATQHRIPHPAPSSSNAHAAVALVLVWSFNGPDECNSPDVLVTAATKGHASTPQTGAQASLYTESGQQWCAGMYGQSSVRLVDLQTGSVIREHKMDPTDFGEGLTKLGNTCATSSQQSQGSHLEIAQRHLWWTFQLTTI